MRTRRIAIGCRRTGSANPVSIAPSGSAGAPDLWPGEFLPFDLTMRFAPLPSHAPGAAPTDRGTDGRANDRRQVPNPALPPPGEQDLTLADLTIGRRDLTWNQNPGWPAAMEFDRTTIARGHQARHARRRLPTIPHRVFAWTAVGVVAAVLLTVLITTIGELVT